MKHGHIDRQWHEHARTYEDSYSAECVIDWMADAMDVGDVEIEDDGRVLADGEYQTQEWIDEAMKRASRSVCMTRPS